MKKIFTKLIGVTLGLAMAVGVGVGFAAGNRAAAGLNAEDVTYVLTIDESDFNTTSYAANNNEKTSDAVCTTDGSKTMEVKWTSYQVYQNSSVMQWQKNAGYIYNSTDLGTINSVTVNSSAGTFTTYYGTSEQPSSGTAGSGKGFFKTSVGNATGKTSSLVINFTVTEGGELTPMTAPTISLDGTVVSWANISGNNGYSYSITGTVSRNGNLDQNVTSLDVSTLNLGYGDFSITIVTKGNGTTTSNSVPSNSQAFSFAEPTVSGTFNLFSGALVEGDYVVVYNNFAMKNIVSNNKLQYTAVSPAENSLSNPVVSIVWHIAQSGNYWTLYNAAIEKYAGSTSYKNQAALLDDISDNAKWTVSGNSTYDFENLARSSSASDPNNKWLRLNADNGFACYQTGTGGALSLYRKVISATGISLDNDELLIGVGGHSTLVATLSPNGASGSITWSSDDEGVATVDQNGVVTGVGAGSATITASVSALIYAECEVTVTAASIPAESVTLNKNSNTLVVGQTDTLTAEVLPANTTDELEWSTSDSGVATVADGLVTAVAAGTATITASAGEQSAQYALTVQALTAATNYVGANVNIKGEVVAVNGKNAMIDDGTSGLFTYSASNVAAEVGDIVTVTGTTTNYNGGLEVASAVLTASSGSISKISAEPITEQEVADLIAARAASNSYYVPHRKVSLRTGETSTYNTNYLTWSYGTSTMETSISKANMVAGKVYDIEGYLVNFYNGMLCICVTSAQEPEIAPESISLNESELVLDKGSSETLVATINPDGASAEISWSSEDDSIAEVDDNGVVTANAEGTTTITAFIDADSDGVADGSEIKAECEVTVQKVVRSADVKLFSANLTSTASVDNNSFSIDVSALSKKTGYYEDGAATVGDTRGVVVSTASPMFALEPAKIVFKANLAGGTAKTLGNAIKVCFIDSEGAEIEETKVDVTDEVTTSSTAYTVEMPYSASAYGVKLMHNKEQSYNARYYSFELSYNYADAFATIQGNETAGGVENVTMKFGASISTEAWGSAWGTISDYGVLMFKAKSALNTYSDTPIADALRGGKALTDIHKGSGVAPSPDGNYHIFTAQVNVTSAEKYDLTIFAAPYVKVGDTYYILGEMHFSARTLAQYYRTNGGSSLSNDALDSIINA